jgi:hypothetical protein
MFHNAKFQDTFMVWVVDFASHESLSHEQLMLQEKMKEHPENNGSRKAKHKPLLRKSERLLKDLADGKPDKPPS